MSENVRNEIVAGGVDWYALVFAVISRWQLVAAGAVVGLLFAILQLHSAHYVYSVQMVVTPVRPSGETAGNSQLGSLGGLATLAGISVPANQAATDFRLFIDSLHSRVVADQLAKDPGLMKKLFAGQWDEEAGSWKKPPVSTMQDVINGIKRFMGLPESRWTPPNGAQLQQFITSNVQIIQDPKKTYLATIELDSSTPQFAASFLTKLDAAADESFRDRALTRARQYINYLTGQLDTVTVAEHRQALMNSLSQQEQIAMAANSAVPYQADIFDGPSISPLPIYPAPKSIFERDVVMGGLLGAVLALLLYFRNTGLGGTIQSRLSSARKR